MFGIMLAQETAIEIVCMIDEQIAKYRGMQEGKTLGVDFVAKQRQIVALSELKENIEE